MGTYILDGIPLDDATGRFWLDNQTGVRILPARRAASTTLPGRDGLTTQLNPNFEGGSVLLSIVVRGTTHKTFMDNLELLYGVLGQRGRLLPLEHDIDGTSRYIDVQIISSAEPEMLSHRAARVKVIASAPRPFWRSGLEYDSLLNITASTVTGTLTTHDGTTATIDDAIIRVKGGLSGATLTDPTTGDFIKINAALSATEYAIITVSDWTVRKVISNTWNRFSAGSVDWAANVESSRGSGPMLTLSPDFATGAARLRLSVIGTGTLTSPTVEVRAKRSYL